MINKPTPRSSRIAILLSGIAVGAHLLPNAQQQASPEATEVMTAREFVLIGDGGAPLARWSASDSHPRLEFLESSGEPLVRLGVRPASNAFPGANNPPVPHLSLFEVSNPDVGAQPGMILEKAGPRVSQTFYDVQADGSSPVLRLEASPSAAAGEHAASVVLSGPDKATAQLRWTEYGTLDLLIGGGTTGEIFALDIDPEGVIRARCKERERTIELFD